MSDALQSIIKQAEAKKLEIQLNLQLARNLKLFEHKFPKVHKVISKHKPQKVVLHLDPNGQLNLVDKEKREYLYNIPPFEYCQKQVDLFSHENKVRKFRIAKSEEYNARHIHIPYLNKLIDNYERNKVQRLKNTPKLITNLIISGVGIGYHLNMLIERFDIHNIFIYEKDLDCFYASLNTIDWAPVLQYFQAEHRSITFCVGVSPEKALAQMEVTINHRGLFPQIFNFVFKHTARKVEDEFIEAHCNELRAYLCGLGYYDDEQIGLAHALHNLRTKSAVFISEKTYKRKSRLLLIGNGPSLDYHKEYIERNQTNAIIMTCGTALGSLLRMGIKPDFHVEMERTVSMNDFLSYGTTDEMRSGINLLCLHTVSPSTISAFGDACYAIKSNDAGGALIHNYYSNKSIQELPFCNPTVANCGLSFAVYMGFQEVHLIGVDLGVPEVGKHHSQYSLHYDMERHVKKDQNFNYNYQDDNNIFRKGNFGGTIKTHRVLDSSRLSIERLLELVLKVFPDFRCINTNQGAKIRYTDSQLLDSLPDCDDHNKSHEIEAIKDNHFYHFRNSDFESQQENEILSHFYQLRDQIKLSEHITNDFDLIIEMNRIYALLSVKEDPVSHFLLRGSVNTFFGAIIQYSIYCQKNEDFKEQYSAGRLIYNEFIDLLFKQMLEDPFRLDDTQNPILAEMQELKISPDSSIKK